MGGRASCDPAEVAHIEREQAKNQHNFGVGVVDKRTGTVRLFPFDDTDAFSQGNRHLQVAAGHESAAAMAGIPPGQARGFVVGKQGGDWHVINQSHLNRPDGQANPIRMDDALFAEIVTALEAAGARNPVIH